MPLPQAAGAPARYHVVYRVTAASVVSTEELWVHRPFDAEDVTYSGATTSAKKVSSIVTRLGRQMLQDAGGDPAVFEPAPVPTSFDVRLDALATARIPHGQLARRGEMRIAGRTCRVYRTAHALSAPTLSGRPTSANHVDTCVDAQGLVLDERHVSSGKTALERRAATVDVDATPPHAFTVASIHVPLNQGGGKVVTLSDTSRAPGQPSWELAQPPEGFTHVGRFAVVPPHQRKADPLHPATVVTAIDDVYTRGVDVIVVEQAQSSGKAWVLPADGTAVDLGALGEGRLVLSPLASSVTARAIGANGFVRVSGTVPPSLLVRVARALTSQPAGTLTTVADATSDGP